MRVPLSILAAALALAPAMAPAAEQPNLVIILADDMGYSDPGFMGGEAATPNLDRLAGGGLLFTDCTNNAKCAPTRASLMTGLYCQRSGAHRSAGNIVGGPGIPIAELLKANGYATFLAGKWHIKPDPLDCGFEQHYGALLTPTYFWPSADVKGGVQLNGERAAEEAPEDWYSTIAYTDFAIESIRMEALNRRRPFFLYLAYHAPHWPLHALPEDIGRYRDRYVAGTDVLRRQRYERMVELGLVDRATCALPPLEEGVPKWDELPQRDQKRMAKKLAIHAAMVDRMDREIGRLLVFLRDSGLSENTLIAFMSDNGACAEGGMLGDGYEEKFKLDGELGTADSFPAIGKLGASLANTPLRKYKSTLYGGGCRTPLVIHWPQRLARPGRRSSDTVHAIDLVPTFLEAAGIPYPASMSGKQLVPLDGVSLMATVEGRPLPPREVFWNFKSARAVRAYPWKMIGQSPVRGRKGKPWELYDLQVDRSEARDVSAEHPEILATLSGRWDVWNTDTGALTGYEAWLERKAMKPKHQDEERAR